MRSIKLIALAAALLAALLFLWPQRRAPHAAAGLVAPMSACPTRPSATAQKAEMLCLINWTRRRRGLKPLQRSRVLERSARFKLAQLSACGELEHEPCGHGFMSSFRRAGYGRSDPAFAVGENLAYGSGTHARVRAVYASWLSSQPHLLNLLDPRWREAGLAHRSLRSFAGAAESEVWVSQFGSGSRASDRARRPNVET